MIDNDRLARQYPELHTEVHDALTRQVVDDLERVYALTPPPNLRDTIDAAVQERAAARKGTSSAEIQNTVYGRTVRRRFFGHWRPLVVCVVALGLAAAMVEVPLVQQQGTGGSFQAEGIAAQPTVRTPLQASMALLLRGSKQILVGTSSELRHSSVSIHANASRIFCVLNMTRLPKGTTILFRFQQSPSGSDYYTQPVAVTGPSVYAFVYGPLPKGAWRCSVDVLGAHVGSVNFRVL